MTKTNDIRQRLQSDSIQDFKAFAEEAQTRKILILTHSNPDGDAIGSALGMYHLLKDQHLSVNVACLDPAPDSFQFVNGAKEIMTDFNENDYDTFVFLDCGDKRLTRFHDDKPRILSDDVYRVNIDHHPTNDDFGSVNIVVTTASSTCEILYYLFREAGFKITPKMATALLLGIYTDTGGFVHQNTTPKTYLAAAELIEKGGKVNQIAKNVFRSYEFKTLKLWAKVLQNLHVTEDGAAIVGIQQDDYVSLGATRKDLAGVVDLINSMPEARYSVMLSEDEKGNVKASLRTRKDDVDVKALAEKFGGGGHIKASGFTIPHGKLKKEVKWKIVTE